LSPHILQQIFNIISYEWIIHYCPSVTLKKAQVAASMQAEGQQQGLQLRKDKVAIRVH
jgi:hypothetical protein